MPASAVLGETIPIGVTVDNLGNRGVVADLLVTLSDASNGASLGRALVPRSFLSAGASVDLTFSWDTSGATLGEHVLIAVHHLLDDDGSNNSSSGIVALEPPLPSLNVGVVTDEPFVEDGDRLRFVVKVTFDGKRVGGAAVDIDVTTGNGNIRTLHGSTDDKGERKFRMKVDSSGDGCGTYTADVTASKSGFNGAIGSQTFEVEC